MSKPNMLDTIIAAQKEKNPSAEISKSSIEETLANVDTLSAADFKKLLAGEQIQTNAAAPANNVIEIAQDIKKLTEMTEVQTVNDGVVTEIIDKTHDNIEQIAAGIKSLDEVQKESAITHEEHVEEARLMEEQAELLKDIEKNTRPKGEVQRTAWKTDTQQSSMIPGLMGFLGGGLAGAIGGLGIGAAGGGILAALTGGITKFISKLFMGLLKGSIITMLVGGLASGVVDAMDKYKETGNLTEAVWAGLGGLLEFLSFGFFDEDDLSKLRSYLEDRWKSFEDGVKAMADAIIPETWKKKTTAGGSQENIVTRAFADQGQMVSELKIVDPETKEEITGKELKKTTGDNIFTVNMDGQEYQITKDTWVNAKRYADEGQHTYAKLLIKKYAVNEDKELGPVPTFDSPETLKIKGQENLKSAAEHTSSLDFDEFAPMPNIKADRVIDETKENMRISDELGGSANAPIVVNAPTTNTSMSHTTAMPPIQVRPNDIPNLVNSYSFP